MGLMDKLKKNSRVESEVITKSKYYGKKDQAPTEVPMLNVALSGHPEGGLSPGVTILAGPSKHFKTSFALKLASAYMKKHPDAIMIFYDSEFGSPQSYFEMFDIDMERVLHSPITNIEELKFDIATQLKHLEKGEKCIIVADSIGNLASIKEVQDAEDAKSKQDMTRAKELKSVFRIITPILSMKDIPFIGIGHIYETQEMYSKPVVSGGKGLYYSADDIWIIGRQQEKEGTEVVGYNFIINIEKSRYVREKTKIPITVTWEGGINQHSGLFDVAVEAGFIQIPSKGFYHIVDPDTGEVGEKKLRRSEIGADFFDALVKSKEFQDYVISQYRLELASDKQEPTGN